MTEPAERATATGAVVSAGGVGTTSIWMYSVRGTFVPPVVKVMLVGLALTYLT